MTLILNHNLTQKQTKPITHIFMKKIIYIILLALTSTFAITACTEEEVTPTADQYNGGAESSPGKL
jgi:hypothetical protein